MATSIRDTGKYALIQDGLDDHTCDTIRIAMCNATLQGMLGQGTTSRPYNPAYVTYFLQQGYNVVVDPNHTYPKEAWQDGRLTPANTISTVVQRCKDMADYNWHVTYPNRFILEPLNECVHADADHYFQDIRDQLRAYGYDGWLLYNICPFGGTPQQPYEIDDAGYNKIAGGCHLYMNLDNTTVGQHDVSWGLNWSRKWSNHSPPIRCINTEIGAHWNEYGSFTTANVQVTTDYFQACYNEGMFASGNPSMRKIVNCLWMNHDIDNLR